MSDTVVLMYRLAGGELVEIGAAESTLAGDQPALPVRIVQSSDIAVTVTGQAFTGAVPGVDETGQLVRVIPTGAVPREQALTVTLPDDEPTRIVYLATRTKGTSSAGNISSKNFSADVQAMHVSVVESALPSGAATAAKQDDGNTSLSSIVARLPAALGPGGGIKTDDTLGSGLGVARGNATAVSTALPAASYQFGFVFKNVSPTLTIWIKQGTVTMADGYPLGPGDRLHLSLPNPSILHVITSAGSAPFAIAAVTP